MTPMGFAAKEFAAKNEQRRREGFLDQNVAPMPWGLLVEQMAQSYLKGGRG